MLQVCLNGARGRAECAHLPVTPEELAVAARTAVAAGAQDIHLHPKTSDGHDTLEPGIVRAALTAVRAVAPRIPVGVTTGAWTTPDLGERIAQIRSWTVLPDHASVNWHEDGAAAVATALLDRGVGIEAGIYSGTDAVQRFLEWSESRRVLRILAEITDTNPQTAIRTATDLLDELRPASKSAILLHGEDDAAWQILQLAASLQLDMRIGLEDVLHLPDGTTAQSNADLIAAARLITQRASEQIRARPSSGARHTF